MSEPPLSLEWLQSLVGEERQAALDKLRRRAITNELTVEETRILVAWMRENRVAAATAAAKKPRAASTKAKAAPKTAKAQAKLIDGNALLDELGGL